MANNKGMKSARQKRLAGTIQKRDLVKEQNENAVANSVSFLPGTQIAIPAEITDDYVKDFFQNEINMLTTFQLLTPADLPELTQMCILLQQLREVYRELGKISITDDFDKYDALTKLSIKIGNRFSELAKKYFISPVARTKLALDSETLKKLSTENKERSATSKLLSRKQQ